jgi:hypothetical protein
LVPARAATLCLTGISRYLEPLLRRILQGFEMNAPTEMSHEEVLRVKLEVLRREHRDLDEAISALSERTRPDQLTLRRLKKQKLALKDQITRIEDELTPDIIA